MEFTSLFLKTRAKTVTFFICSFIVGTVFLRFCCKNIAEQTQEKEMDPIGGRKKKKKTFLIIFPISISTTCLKSNSHDNYHRYLKGFPESSGPRGLATTSRPGRPMNTPSVLYIHPIYKKRKKIASKFVGGLRFQTRDLGQKR